MIAQGLPRADAARIAALPPVSIMFAALLGYNPVQTLLGHTLSQLPPSHAAYLTGHTFFPSLISPAFQHGLAIAFDFAIVACLVAAVASLLRGGKYVHGAEPEPTAPGTQMAVTVRWRDEIPAQARPRDRVLARTGAHDGIPAAVGEFRRESPARVAENTLNGASNKRL